MGNRLGSMNERDFDWARTSLSIDTSQYRAEERLLGVDVCQRTIIVDTGVINDTLTYGGIIYEAQLRVYHLKSPVFSTPNARSVATQSAKKVQMKIEQYIL